MKYLIKTTDNGALEEEQVGVDKEFASDFSDKN